MSSTRPNTHRYVVYLPYIDKGRARPFRVSEDADVQDLINEICQYAGYKNALDNQIVDLYKVGVQPDDLGIEPSEKLHERAVDWLRKDPLRNPMQPALSLADYFPSGPARREEKKIDIVVVAESTGVSSSAEGHIDDSEMTGVVNEFLKNLEGRLREHLKSAPWRDTWQAPQGASPEYARFIEELEIPQVEGFPVLLLHNLGDGVVDTKIISQLGDGSSKMIINTSGSGKTRLLLELLATKWGLYFTTLADPANLRLGSTDIHDAIFKWIPKSKGFCEHPKGEFDNNHVQLEPVYRQNREIVTRFSHQILTARVIIFEWFLTTYCAVWQDKDKDPNKAKLHWLSLQLNSRGILGCDVFKDLAKILDDAGDSFIMMDSNKIHERLQGLSKRFKLDSSFFLVLDEAQIAAASLANAFESYRELEKTHPILNPLIKSWLAATSFPIIVSSTGLSINTINDTLSSAVGKPATFGKFTKIGAFDNQVPQENYIRRYTPPTLLDSESGKEFLTRAWNYARGRHRFTASLLTELLRTSFQAPHRTLDGVVTAISGYVPTDAQHSVDREGVVEGSPRAIVPLDFTKIMSNPEVLSDVSHALHSWLVLQIRVPFSDTKLELIELGFARFVSDSERSFIDEPLVLLAAARAFSESSFGLVSCICTLLLESQDRGDHFEELVAYSLACAFDGSSLCDIISFGEHVPEWAQQSAELVSVSMNEGGLVFDRFHLPNYEGSTTIIGAKHSTVDATLRWFQNTSSVLCFPDKLMGPDIVSFIRLHSGQVLALVIQCRFRRKMDKQTWESAVKSLDLSQLYVRQGLGTENINSARSTVIDLFRRLDVGSHFANDDWFQDKLPVLRVIASYPGSPSKKHREKFPHHTTLNMDHCLRLSHAEALLENLPSSLGIRKRKDVNVDTPAKRQHT